MMAENVVKNPFNREKFYNNLMKIALPIVIQNLIASSLNMVDTVMIGRVGEIEIAAVGIANQYFFLFNLLVMGLASGCGVFISQFWGKKDKKNIRRVLGVGVISSIICSLLFTFFALLIPKKIISLFNSDPYVIDLGARYLKIVCLSYLFTGLTFAYGIPSRCVEKAILPMGVSMVALLTNAVLNYVLIFGHFGAPAMGVEGAALATLIARVVETLSLIGYIYFKKEILAASIKEMIDVSKGFIIKVYEMVIPVVLNEICWGLGMIIYAIAYGHIGTQAMAAIQICTTIQNVFMVLSFGLGSAAAVMIGHQVGSDNIEGAEIYAKRFSRLAVIIGLSIGIALALAAPFILSFFNISEAVFRSALRILQITSTIMVVKVFNITLIVGILRGGGDASHALKVEAITMWGIGVPLAFIGSFLLKFPVEGVVALVCAEEIVKCIFSWKRLRTNKWIRQLTN